MSVTSTFSANHGDLFKVGVQLHAHVGLWLVMNCKYYLSSRCQLYPKDVRKHLRIAQDSADCPSSQLYASQPAGTMALRRGTRRGVTLVWTLLLLAAFCLPTIYSHGAEHDEPRPGDENNHPPIIRLDKNMVQDKE